MLITFRPLRFNRIAAILAVILFTLFIIYVSNVHLFNSSRNSGGIPNDPVFRPFQNPVDPNEGVLGVLPESALSGDKFIQPAFLEDLGDLETSQNDAQKPEEQHPQGRVQEGKGIILPKFSIEEIRGSADMELKDPDLASKRQKIKEMTKHAWDNYVKYAWGHNELRPKSKTFHDTDILGRVPLGATIVDSIDTLYIMGLEKEYEQASKWIKDKLDFSDAPTEVSVFEITIRFVGGLLSIYSLTGERFYLDRAQSIIDNLLPAFDPKSGLPYSLYNLQQKKGRNPLWASNQCHILSEVGTLHMEFQYISELLGQSKYSEIVHRIRNYLVEASKTANGEFRTHIHHKQPAFCNRHVTVSGEGDSFFEYLLKEWIRTDHEDVQAIELYNKSLATFDRLRMIQTSAKGSVYLTDSQHGSPGQSMSHLSCFAGGMFALGAEKKDENDVWFKRAKDLTETCHKSYAQTETGLGPESFVFTASVDAVAVSTNAKFYYLRPETVESYFYMWRFTHDPVYRQYAWDVVQALERHCRVECGYSGLINVNDPNPRLDDVQQSYFIAETLKYLYLIFCDDSVFPLNRWVFNTEGHPFPILPRSTT